MRVFLLSQKLLVLLKDFLGEKMGVDSSFLQKKTWSNVVKNPPTQVNEVKFDYCPRPEGVKVVSPPLEVLQEGNDRFKNCLVGTFSKATRSYNAVVSFARRMWGDKLLSVTQKDSHTFFFKFNSSVAMKNLLSRGTYYVEQKPMIMRFLLLAPRCRFG